MITVCNIIIRFLLVAKHAVLFVILISFNVNAYMIYHKCLRFNEAKLTIPLRFYGESDLTGDRWITVSYDGYSWFNANKQLAESSGTDAEFDQGINPKDGFDEENEGMRIYWPESGGHIICQWDIQDNQNIGVGDVVNGRILKTLEGYSDEFGNYQFDTTIYCFTPTNTAYCFEFSGDSNVKLEIYPTCVFPWNDEYEVPIERCKTENGSYSNKKRAYKIDFLPYTNYYVKIHGDYNYTYYSQNHNYSFTIKEVKPIVLVHGICARPLNETDDETTFGSIPDEFPYLTDLPPNVIFDFPWNSNNGLYSKYCNDQGNIKSLYSFVYEKREMSRFKPVLIVHSIGGILTLKQMETNSAFLGLIDSFVFFSSPFCGSDASSAFYAKLPHFRDCFGLHVSQANVDRLQRGINQIWSLLEDIPNKFFTDHSSSYILGTRPKLYVLDGGESSDGVVKNASGNLPRILFKSETNVKCYYFNHIDIKNLEVPYLGDYNNIFNILKSHIE